MDQDREKALQEVKMYQSNDWDLKEETPEFFMLTRERKANGFIVFIGLCFWLVPGVLYYIWIKSTPEKKKIIK
jgi:hypothetical protein